MKIQDKLVYSSACLEAFIEQKESPWTANG